MNSAIIFIYKIPNIEGEFNYSKRYVGELTKDVWVWNPQPPNQKEIEEQIKYCNKIYPKNNNGGFDKMKNNFWFGPSTPDKYLGGKMGK